MSAINTLVFQACCPVCQQLAKIRCQIHIARLYGQDFSGAIESGEYSLGQPMLAVKKDEKRIIEWLSQMKGKRVTECCYATCDCCKSDLFVVVEFCELTATAISKIGREIEWPAEFPG